jgi:hypothetical protein
VAKQEELEIEIDANGRVQVHVKGMPGKRCLDYLKVFQDLLGPVTDQRPTEEFYQETVQTEHVKSDQSVRW